MPKLYFSANGASPNAAALVPVTTGSVVKTMLQIATPAATTIRIVEWGISFDGSAAAVPIRCELFESQLAATVTAHIAAGVMPYNAEAGAVPSTVTLSATATGYTATVENAATSAIRYADLQFVAPTSQYIKQWPLGNEFQVPVSKFLRVRVTAPVAVNCYCYVIWAE